MRDKLLVGVALIISGGAYNSEKGICSYCCLPVSLKKATAK